MTSHNVNDGNESFVDPAPVPFPARQFAVVAPIGLQVLLGHEVCGSYHLLLAHEVLENGNRYEKYFDTSPYDDFIIMDNSLIELGHPMEPTKLLQAASIVDANCLVLPDMLREGAMTVEMSQKAAHELGGEDCGFPFLGVVQGKDIQEARDCAQALLEIPGVKYLSVPKVIADKNEEHSRWPYLEMLRDIGVKDRCVHLLGFSDFMFDDMICVAKHPLVMGIDSATPVWYGKKERFPKYLIPFKQYDWGRRPQDYFGWGAVDFTEQMTTNIERVSDWISNNGHCRG